MMNLVVEWKISNAAKAMSLSARAFCPASVQCRAQSIFLCVVVEVSVSVSSAKNSRYCASALLRVLFVRAIAV